MHEKIQNDEKISGKKISKEENTTIDRNGNKKK